MSDFMLERKKERYKYFYFFYFLIKGCREGVQANKDIFFIFRNNTIGLNAYYLKILNSKIPTKSTVKITHAT